MDLAQNISISVVIPAYNSADTIEAALASVAEQGVNDIEIIVVDDASTDNTAEIVRAWGEGRVAKLSSCQVVKCGECERDGKQDRGQRIDVSVNTPATASFLCSSQPTTEQLNNPLALSIFVLAKNAGPAAARNRGIAEAKGEWIAFLDADDEWLPGKLELQMRIAEANPEIDLWCGPVQSTEGEVVKLPGCQVVELGEGERDETEDRPKMQDAGCRMQDSKKNLATEQPNNPATGKLYQELRLDDFVVANPIATSTVMVRKSALEEVGGFDEQFRGPEDYDLWVRIAGRKPAMQTEDCRPQTADGRRKTDGGDVAKLSGCQVVELGKGERDETEDRPKIQDAGCRTQDSKENLATEQLNNSATAICRMGKLHAPLARYRSESGSLSMDDRKFLPQVLRVLDKAFGEGGALAEFADMKKLALASQYRSASWMAFCRGSRRDAIRLLIKGWCLGRERLALTEVTKYTKPEKNLRWRPWCRMLARYIFGKMCRG